MTTLRRTARLTGVAYLGLALCGLIGFLYVRGRLYVPDDAVATAANLVAQEGLARIGIAADLGTVLTQALAAVCFLRLFRDTDAVTAGWIAAFGLVNAVAVMVGTTFTSVALAVALRGGPTAAADALLLYDLNAAAWLVGGLFFGLWLIPMGRLVLQSGRMPRLLGQILIVGGVGYILNTFARSVAPDLPALGDVLVLPASVGEFWMIGYLLIRGVRDRASERSETAPAVP